MDRMPLVPKLNESQYDAERIFRENFQENLENEIFPLDIAQNILKYNNIDEDLSLKETAGNVIQINKNLAENLEEIEKIELNILTDHFNYIIRKSNMEKDEFLKEMSKLSCCDIFLNQNAEVVEKYGLIRKCDLYPDVFKRFLDFRFNLDSYPDRKCKCCSVKQRTIKPDKQIDLCKKFVRNNKELNQRKTTAKKDKDDDKKAIKLKKTFIIEPKLLLFNNYEINEVYEQTAKIININSTSQTIVMNTFLKSGKFQVFFDGEKLAPGMSTTVKIRFTPKYYADEYVEMSFRNSKGEISKLSIHCKKDPPKLYGFLNRSNDYSSSGIFIEKKRNISEVKKFSLKRQEALNQTIDVGSCFVTDFTMVQLILKNVGEKAKFFWVSEENWYFENVINVSTEMELTTDGFWLYPTFFEISNGDCCEINIIFQPTHSGLYTQTFFLISDNNNFQQIEFVGDAFSFNENIFNVSIPDVIQDLQKQKSHTVFLGYMKPYDYSKINLNIRNKSALLLQHEFKWINDNNSNTNNNAIMADWFEIEAKEDFLMPYSIAEETFTIIPKNSPSGYYNSFLRLFIKNVPIASLDEHADNFTIAISNGNLRHAIDNLSSVDILIMEIEIALYLDSTGSNDLRETEQQNSDGSQMDSSKSTNSIQQISMENLPLADLLFSNYIVDFGLLPIGINVEKTIYIENVGEKRMKWCIKEVKYQIDKHPYFEILTETNLSRNSGFLAPHKKRKLQYRIVKQPLTVQQRWLSILVLFSMGEKEETEKIVAHSICLVTFGFVETNLVIKTPYSTEPILCPLEMIYVDVPVILSVQICNDSLITGCFYLFPPIGSEAGKIKLEFNPQSGEIKPMTTQNIKVKLTCNDVGILEDISIPCFIGNREKPPQLIKLMCAVDCIHVFFYLPIKPVEYQKVLWPPKVIYERGESWHSHCCSCGEEQSEMIKETISKDRLKIENESNATLSKLNNTENPSSNASITSNRMHQSLLGTLVDLDSEIFLQEYIVEMNDVQTKSPKNFEIFIENITPKAAKYCCQSTTYKAVANCNIEKALKCTYKTIEEIWEPLIQPNKGILIQPRSEIGRLGPNQMIPIDIWIYSNTWGIYTEEIIIDIDDIASFSFSVVVEIVGCPLQVPMGLGTITEYPTIRFGSIPFQSDSIEKDIVILNSSSINIEVSWHMFLEMENLDSNSLLPPFNFICDVLPSKNSNENFQLNFTDRFYGCERGEIFEIQPSKIQIPKYSKTSVSIKLNSTATERIEESHSVNGILFGHIFPVESERFKSNYFYRKPSNAIIKLTANLVKPYLDLELTEDNTKLNIYANEVALFKRYKFYLKLKIRNPMTIVIEARLRITKPFRLEQGSELVSLMPDKCQEISILCHIKNDQIIEWSKQIYQTDIEIYHLDRRNSDEEERILNEIKLKQFKNNLVDRQQRILTMNRKLFIEYQNGLSKEEIPLELRIHYPNISVKPAYLKFGYVLLGRTVKGVVTVFNLTGYKVAYQVYKTLKGQEIFVSHPKGEIEKSVGINSSFVNLEIYFTPMERRIYRESIRIETNIPQCFIDVSIKGNGSCNEKFDTWK